MKIYLVRHAQAHSVSDSDANRSLTEDGERDAAALGRKLCDLEDFSLDRIVHSGYVRAKQTAEIIYGGISGKVGGLSLEVDPSLIPHADINAWVAALNKNRNRNIMLVGHMPFMGELAHRLLGGYCDFKRPSCRILTGGESGWGMHSYITAQS